MNVLRADVFQIDAVDLRRHFHVVLHAWHGLDVVDAIGDLEQSAAVMYPEVLHGLRDGETDGRASARFVGNDQVSGERVEPTIDALDAGIKRLEVDADIGVLAVRHPYPSIKHMFLSNTCSIIPARPDTVKTDQKGTGLFWSVKRWTCQNKPVPFWSVYLVLTAVR